MTAQDRRSSEPDRQGRGYLASALAGAAAIVSIEAFLVFPGHLLAAQIIYAALVLVLVNAGPRHETATLSPAAETAVAALRALALVPLLRVVALGLPMRDWTEPVAVMAVALPVGLVALRLAPLVRLRLRTLLSVRLTFADAYATLAGVVLGLVACVAGAPTLWPDGAPDGRIALGIAAATLAAAVEELVFRGLVQGTLQRAAGRVGMLVAGAVFTATYLDAGATALVLTIALAGAIFGHAVARGGRLAGVVTGHVLLVVGAGAIWPALLDESRLPEVHEPRTTIVLSIAIACVVVLACWQPVAPTASSIDRS